MGRRRYQPTILNPVDEPRWLVVHTAARECIAAIYLPPRADLRAALEAAAERFTRNGWTLTTKDLRWGARSSWIAALNASASALAAIRGRLRPQRLATGKLIIWAARIAQRA